MKQTAPYLKHHDLSFEKDHSMEALASLLCLICVTISGIDRKCGMRNEDPLPGLTPTLVETGSIQRVLSGGEFLPCPKFPTWLMLLFLLTGLLNSHRVCIPLSFFLSS
jgi:hypothetical protein